MKYRATAIKNDGTEETRILNLPYNFEAAEAEAECYFSDIKYIDLVRL